MSWRDRLLKVWNAWQQVDAFRGLVEVVRAALGIFGAIGIVGVVFGFIETTWLLLFLIPMLAGSMIWYVQEVVVRRRLPPSAPATVVRKTAPAYVICCGIRWEWDGGWYANKEPRVEPFCPEHPEVRLRVQGNDANEIRFPHDSDWIGSGMREFVFRCSDGPHFLYFEEACDTRRYDQVRDRAIQMMEALLRKERTG